MTQNQQEYLISHIVTALSFNRRGGVCPPEDINLSICGRIRAGKSCPYKYLAKADIHFNILNERAVAYSR